MQGIKSIDNRLFNRPRRMTCELPLISIPGHPNIRSSTCPNQVWLVPKMTMFRHFLGHAITDFASCEHLRTPQEKKTICACGAKQSDSFSHPNS